MKPYYARLDHPSSWDTLALGICVSAAVCSFAWHDGKRRSS